jgi:hypothetical protein
MGVRKTEIILNYGVRKMEISLTMAYGKWKMSSTIVKGEMKNILKYRRYPQLLYMLRKN